MAWVAGLVVSALVWVLLVLLLDELFEVRPVVVVQHINDLALLGGVRDGTVRKVSGVPEHVLDDIVVLHCDWLTDVLQELLLLL